MKSEDWGEGKGMVLLHPPRPTDRLLEIHREIYSGKLVGMKNFYHGDKTDWAMHEYRLQPNFANYHYYSGAGKKRPTEVSSPSSASLLEPSTEHVPCFSNHNSDPEILPSSYAPIPAFPSLRSLHENLQLPLFFTPPPTAHQINVGHKVEGSELDCFWS
ncbi:hypothetical protein SASPL_139281 [Salvia splendens]|uniref:NAC domain-containing protein n=1 Tax=Salvia splendens TaxID=180675 RepID=A0A8X8ZAV1_SALSN|nr:hypothetical protein SASPL_139281 [Salvia splendens]